MLTVLYYNLISHDTLAIHLQDPHSKETTIRYCDLSKLSDSLVLRILKSCEYNMSINKPYPGYIINGKHTFIYPNSPNP